MHTKEGGICSNFPPFLASIIALLRAHVHVELHAQALLAFMPIHKTNGMQLSTSLFILSTSQSHVVGDAFTQIQHSLSQS